MEKIKIKGKEYQVDLEWGLEVGVIKEINKYGYKDWDEYVSYMNMIGIKPTWDNLTPINPDTPKISEEQYAFEALGKLIQLRNNWWGKWKSDWNKISTKYTIVNSKDRIIINTAVTNSRILSFPTAEMAEEFYGCFKKLIEQAKNVFVI